jgi:hypothetical protein
LAAGGAEEQGVQGGSLVFVECSENVVLNRDEGALGAQERLPSGGGELDDVAAAVGGVAPARE